MHLIKLIHETSGQKYAVNILVTDNDPMCSASSDNCVLLEKKSTLALSHALYIALVDGNKEIKRPPGMSW